MTSVLRRLAAGVSSIAWWLTAIWLAGFATLGRPKSGQSMASFLNAPITVGDLVAFVVVSALVAGLGKLTARIASRKGGNYVGWSYYGLLVPYIALPHALLRKADAPAPTVTP